MNGKIISVDSEYFQAVKAQRIGRSRPLIAVIDDDELVRGLVVSVLAQLGRIATAMNGPEGIELYGKSAPDLVFLDINMPQISGLEVLKQIMAVDKEAKVIMFSARSTGTNVETAMKMGAIGFITKPFTAELLQQRTAHVLSGINAE